ncbi:MAG: tail fiber domain-containing protein, partial [Flavobacteriales bacterium]
AKAYASTANGKGTKALGSYSSSHGYYSQSYGNQSFAFGKQTKAYGASSTSSGSNTIANADISSASGIGTKANGYASTVIGSYNDSIVSKQVGITNSTPLFIIGNGDSYSTRSNAFTVFKDGRVKINQEYTMPTADGDSNQVMTTDGSGNLSWQNASGSGSRVFEINDSNVRITGGYDTLNFVFGSPQMDDDGTPDNNNRMFYNKDKGAFRAGGTLGKNWDKDSIGDFSFASGLSSKAKGYASTAMGNFSEATGDFSTALAQSRATGFFSLSAGLFSEASGSNSTAIGYYATSSGIYSTSIGYFSNAPGESSLATGAFTEASGQSSTASGSFTKANGDYSTAMNNFTTANGHSSTVVGIFNDTLVSVQNALTNSTPLFIVGNGNNPASLSNALTVYKNGDVEINDAYTLPTNDGATNQVITTDGSGNLSWQNIAGGGSAVFQQNQDDIRSPGGYDSLNFVFGSPQMNDDGNNDHLNRMFFNKEKGAFRAGAGALTSVTVKKNWDNDSIGEYSFATGMGTKASGEGSSAMGYYSYATGDFSFATGISAKASAYNAFAAGRSTKASGDYSSALGYFSEARGGISTAIGNNTEARGFCSMAFGSYTLAKGHYSLVMGKWNDTTFSATNIFEIGNGTNNSNRENALEITSTNNAHFSGSVLPSASPHAFFAGYNVGNSSFRWNTVFANNGVVTTSDTTRKTNIQPLSYGLEDLMKIKTISFNWKGDERQTTKIGFNAQNLLQVIPEVVQTHSDHTDRTTGETTYKENETLGVFYSDMIPVLTKSIQEQQEMIKAQQQQIEELKKMLLEVKNDK